MRTTLPSRAALGGLALTLSLTALTACGDGDSDVAATSSTTATTSGSDSGDASDADPATALSVTDPWVKSADTGMTAAFGTLVNDGPDEIVVTAASSDISPTMELHETVTNADGTMAMQPREGGFVVPAGGEHELAPGGDHLMVMDLTRALKPGESVPLTLTLQGGGTVEVTATVKNFTGAEEKYQHGGDDGAGMDMDDMSSPSDAG